MYDKQLQGTDLVRVILKNIHESLKWPWQIVMALALIKAVEKYADTLDLSSLTNPFDIIPAFFNINTIVFTSFVFIFIRFFFGDSRHLDLSYEETQYLHGLEKELKKYSGFKRLSDILLLLTHGILFYLMALHIDSIINYIALFILLLIFNIIWLFAQYLYSRASPYNIPELLIGNMDRYDPILYWAINNFFSVILISIFLFWSYKYAHIIALLLTIANSIIDFIITWKYYFPDLRQIHEESQKSYSTNNHRH